jgi:multiple sugar transport system substrate-binding protein
MAAGDAPDVIGQCCTSLPEWARKSATENLDPYIRRDWKKEVIADFAELQYDWFNGKHIHQPEVGQYAVPMYMGTIALYYNKNRFQAAGLAFPDDTWDWTKYREAMVRLTDPLKNQFGGYLANQSWDRRQQFVHQNGGNMVDPNDDLKAVVDQPKTVEAFTWIYERMWKEHSAPRYADGGDERPQPAPAITGGYLGTGFVAMVQDGSWILARMTAANIGTEEPVWDCAPLPKGPTGLRDTLATTDGWIMWSGSKNKDAAWELMKFLQTDEWWEINIPITGQQPTRKSLQDRWTALLKTGQAILANVNLKPFTDAVKQNYGRPVELFRFHSEASAIINRYYDASVRDNREGVREAMVKAAAEANEQLKVLAQQAGIAR